MKFETMSKIYWVIIAFVAVLMIAMIVAVIVGANEIANNPEGIGNFFGRIIKGFEEARHE